mgnify:CR=1 FL=1|jgi:N utilization substance protein B
MPDRRDAREVVLQLLYEDDLNPQRPAAPDDELLESRLEKHAKLVEFARGLLEGVRSHRAEIDQTLARLAKNWTLGRMAVTDRNSLRLGAYELLHTDAPGPVAVYESVELAKRFGSSESAGFVNAILDKLRLEVAQQTAPIPETTSDDEQP